MRPIAIAVLALSWKAQTLAQTFEVASVKKGRPDAGFSGGCHGSDSAYSVDRVASAPPLGRCVINDARLSHLIGIAYEIRSMEFLQGGSDWVKSGDVRFNIEAKAEDPNATEAQLIKMLQALLAERFQLKFHRETIQAPGFALVVAKNGPKLTASKGDEVSTIKFSPFKPREDGPNSATARNCTTAMLAADLTQIQPRPVNDETALTGSYDFKLSWDEVAGPSLVTALQEQLGLRLEAKKVPVSIFVVDSAEKPGGN